MDGRDLQRFKKVEKLAKSLGYKIEANTDYGFLIAKKTVKGKLSTVHYKYWLTENKLNCPVAEACDLNALENFVNGLHFSVCKQ